MSPKIDLTGKQFGEWTVLRRSEYKPAGYWYCECSCGTKRDVWSSSLTLGRSKSCGHLNNLAHVHLTRSDGKILGKRFGRLVALKRTNKQGRAKYLCQCDCGNKIVVFGSYLLSGKTKSCGCLRVESSKKLLKQTYEPLKKEVKNATKYGSNIHSINQKLSKNSTTGYKGVSEMKDGKFRAYITVNGKQHTKLFHTLEEAILGRKKLEEEYFDPIREKYKDNKKSPTD